MLNSSALDKTCCAKYNHIGNNIDIIAYFQPIISINSESVIGFESLCRGVCKECGRIILPYELFNKIKDEEHLFNLDLLARKNALIEFNKLIKNNKDLLLFLNFDVSLVEKEIENPNLLVNLLEGYNINPQNIVVEITESKPCDIKILTKFMKSCRSNGFLIALDDVGTGYSNFDRILTIKPDVLKIDRSIISDIDKDYHKKAVFKTLTRLSRKIGTFILAEGVETEGEVVYSVELGAELLQGYYFTMPQKIDTDLLEEMKNKINYAADICKNEKLNKINRIRKNNLIHDEAITLLAYKLRNKTSEEIENIENFLSSFVQEYNFIQSLYIIGDDGFQITDTILNNDICLIKKILYNSNQKEKGYFHYYKDYFYSLQDGPFKKYATDTYISLLTGNLCRTMSLKFTNKENKNYVLCMDIKERK